MILIVDIGNSNIVLAAFDGSNIKSKLRVPTSIKTIDSLSILLKNSKISPGDISACIISSTVPAATEPMQGFVHSYFGLEAKLVSDLNHDLLIKINRAEKLGTDILVNCFAANRIYKKNCIIIDFGTALTFAAITAEKEFLGACITCGFHSSLQSLIAKAAQLQLPEKLCKPASVLNKNTEEAVNSGIFTSFKSIVSGNIRAIKKDFSQMNFISIVTGGSSTLFNQDLENVDFYSPDLTLCGLKLLYDFNNK